MRYDSTHSIYLIKLVDVLREHGVAGSELLRHIKTSPRDLLDRDRTIPLSTYLNAVEFAVASYDIPDLGFLVGEHTSLLEHGVLGYALLSSPNLRESLNRYVRFQYLQGPLLTVRFSSSESIAELTAVPRVGRWKPSRGALKYIIQEWLVGWNQWCQIIGESGCFFSHVRLPYASRGRRRYYADHLGCTVSFNNDATTAAFPTSWLDRPIEYADEAIAALCSAQCERLLEVLDKRPGLVADIHRLLASSPGDVATMDKMAQQLHVGMRTLRRRLKDEGTTYQDVILEFRVAMAKRYLKETQLPANEIASLVGYSDPANLYRAFQADTGMTPGAFRATDDQTKDRLQL